MVEDVRGEPLRLAYMTGEYLRITPFVFIHREIQQLRARGIDISTISVRGLRKGEEPASREQVAEAERTYILLPPSLYQLIRSHWRMFRDARRRYFRSLVLAFKARPPDPIGSLKQVAYFLEAGLVAEFLRHHRIDHLHNHLHNSSCTVAMLAAEMANVPYSWVIHGTPPDFASTYWRLDQKARTASFVVTVSEFGANQAFLVVPEEYRHKFHVIHCGVDPEEFEFQKKAPGTGRIVFTGRLSRMKGVHVLLDSLQLLREKIPTASLVLVGDGPDRADVESRIRDQGLQDCVTVTGYLAPEEVREELQKADVFALPSFAEAIPVALMEAMASGVPVVSCQVGGIGELIEDGVNGLLCPAGDTVVLARQLERILESEGLRDRLRAEARRTVESEFNIRREPERLLELFEKTVANHRV